MRGRVHGDVERVAADDLVQVRRVYLSWIDDWIDAVDDELRACEAQHVALRASVRGKAEEGERREMHD